MGSIHGSDPFPWGFRFPQQPQIILLKEGTDTSQGRAQVVSNISACTAVADTVRTTLGPRGMDKLIHDDKGTTISNDGATIISGGILGGTISGGISVVILGGTISGLRIGGEGGGLIQVRLFLHLLGQLPECLAARTPGLIVVGHVSL